MSSKLCKKCKKRKIDFKQGLLCTLTGEKPSIKEDCVDYEKDDAVKEYRGQPLRPNEGRASILLLFIWFVLLLDIIKLISSCMQYDLLQTVLAGGEVAEEVLAANDIREGVVAIASLIAFLISGILFIRWFRRAYFNLHQKVKYLSFSEGWAAGSWFVPIVSLFRPYQIMSELYEETKSYIERNSSSLEVDLSTRYLGFWWAIWLISGILGYVSARLSMGSSTVSGLLNITVLDIVLAVLEVALGFITLKVVKDYSKVEGHLRFEEHESLGGRNARRE